MNNMGKQLVSRAIKKSVKWVLKKVLVLLAPFIPEIIAVILAFVGVSILVAAVYGSMTSQTALQGFEPSPEDAAILAHYKELCHDYNIIDTWLVSGESSPEKPHYPGKGFENMGDLVDRYRNDYKLRLEWSVVHSVGLYWAFSQGKEEIPASMREKIARDLHPYFFYKESEIITTSTDSEGKTHTNRTTVYLLVEAYTLYGHYQYHYEWVTEGDEDYTVTYERLIDTQQILPNRWQRLDDYIKKLYELPDDDDMELNRTFLMQAAEGYNQQKEWMEWLVRNIGFAGFTSSAMIPPDLIPFFKEAEKEYGIPWWFLAAVAFVESSFNPQAENPRSHCYGLMQLTPSNWEHYSKLLGFDPVLDRDNPRAQILCGAYMLRELGLKNINWKGDWKEDTLGVLTFYGGFRGKDAEERCRREYASKIWEIAEGFTNYGEVTWPVPGYTHISSPFGKRIHPVTGTWDYHGGIDIPAPTGTPVVSVSGGTVIMAKYNDGANGNIIKIRDAVHQYAYCHLNTIDVQVGDVVKPGQIIGTVGNTGRSTGPHLHFEVVDLRTNHRIDPLLLLKW